MKENQRSPKSRNSVNQALKNVFNVKLMPADSAHGFQQLHGINRTPSPAHVTKMSNSIRKFGVIRPIVVANLDLPDLKGLYILDGTHLYHALLRNGMDFPYREVEINSQEELIECLAMLNNSSKTWKLTDYVQSWSYIRSDYKRLSHYQKVYDLEFCSVAGILNNSYNVFGSINVIKDGSFSIKNEEQAVQILDMVSDLVAMFPKYERVQYKNLINGFVHFVRNNMSTYNHKVFMKKLRQHVVFLQNAAATTQTAAEYYSSLITN